MDGPYAGVSIPGCSGDGDKANPQPVTGRASPSMVMPRDSSTQSRDRKRPQHEHGGIKFQRVRRA